MKKIVLALCMLLALCMAACGTLSDVLAGGKVLATPFDADYLIEALCACARAGNPQFSVTFAPSQTLEEDVGAAIDHALQHRFDCAFNVESVVWKAAWHRKYVTCDFQLLYTADAGERPPIESYAALDLCALLQDAVLNKTETISLCIPAGDVPAETLEQALRNAPRSCAGAYFNYYVRSCRWALGDYDDYHFLTLTLDYHPDTCDIEDIYTVDSLLDAVNHMIDAFEDGAESLVLYVRGVPSAQLELGFSIAQVNDGADVVEEAAAGSGSYWQGGDNDYIAQIQMRYDGTAQQREVYRAALRAVLDEMEAEIRAAGPQDDEALYLAICKAINARTKYDHVISDASIAETLNAAMRLSRTAYGALVEGSTVCTGFASAVKALCDRFSLPCWVLMGDFDGTGHAWNGVLLQDELRYIDATFYDTTNDRKHVLFSQAEYEKRGYALETGYIMPEWCADAAKTMPAPTPDPTA